LDAQPTYEVWTEDKYPVVNSLGFTKNATPNLPIMQCPSSTTIESAYARNSYVSNNGMHPFDTIDFARSMNRANGVFNNKYPGANMFAVGDSVRTDDLKDGQGNTVLFSENLQSLPWSNLTVLGYAPDLNYPIESRYVNGFVWHYRDPNSFSVAGAPVSTTPKTVHLINGAAGDQDKFRLRMNALPASHEIADLARPSSAHVSGVNMGFADGSSRYVTDDIDYRIYQAYMTPRGKSSNVPFTEYVLQGEEL
jgi:prepilin-type processing-associated H-X9-DG protein